MGRGAGEERADPLPNAAVAVGSRSASVSAFPPSPVCGEKKKDKGGKELNIKCCEFLPLASNFQLIYVESMVPCSHMDGRLPAIISVNRFVSSIFSCSILLLGNVHISMAYT